MKRSSLGIAAVALLSAAAFAQTEAPQTQGQTANQSSAFQILDADRDGRISNTEAQAAPVVARSFGVADKDGDGSLSQDEFNSSFTTAPPAPRPSAPSAPSEPTPPPPQ
jgi:Ca2+-binding EF-hand superfamily protein